MRIAVTGASGNVGGHVVALLSAEGEHEVVGLSRRGPVRADYDDPVSLRSALAGVDTLVFVSSDGEAVRMMAQHENVVRAAADTGVPHVVYLSGLDVDPASPFCYAATNGATEQLLAASGCARSVVRASLFGEFFASLLGAARETGELRLPAGDAAISLVARADVARCLAALAIRAPTGRCHEVTGPSSLTMDEVAVLAGRSWGRPVRYVDVAEADFVAETALAGESPWWTYAYASMFAAVREDRWARVSGEVLALTGREPAPFTTSLA